MPSFPTKPASLRGGHFPFVRFPNEPKGFGLGSRTESP